MKKIKNPLVIVANGKYPTHPIPVELLKNANYIIACDGGVNNLAINGIIPDCIIGDLDSISEINKEKFKSKTIEISDQSENDLRKAINYCVENKIQDISIIAATGKREDHTIGNIFTLMKYSNTNIKIYSDTGMFSCISDDNRIKSFKGQNISIFSSDKSIKIESKGLKYNFNKNNINSLFYGTLNESIKEYFDINISHGSVIIFQTYK